MTMANGSGAECFVPFRITLELSIPSGVGLAVLLGLVLAQDDSPHAEIAAEALAVAPMSEMEMLRQPSA